MPAGRPDGFYSYSEIADAIDPCFKSEKDLCGFIERNIIDFCKDLGFEYKSHKKEKGLQEIDKRRKGTRRIDFFIKTKCGENLAVECKHPTYKSELSSGVGQILAYIAVAEEYKLKIDRFYMISSKLDLEAPWVISKFKLPITFIVIDKSKMLTWQHP